MEPKRILVTGGAGFIGTHLINHLVQTNPGVSIDVVDNLSNTSMPPERLAFYELHGINFYKTSVDLWRPENKYDQIYHLASPVGPAGVLHYAGRMALMILGDAILMADLAIKNDAKLLLVSTSEVYGKHPEGDLPQQEDIPKVIPSKITVRLEYGAAKMLTEIALVNLARTAPLHFNFVRPFNIVGPYQNGEAGFVLPRFVQSALSGDPLTVFGDGRQKRTFTHVSDIVRAFVMIMDGPVEGQVYNVGNPANVATIEELAIKVVKFSGSGSKIDHMDPKTIYGNLYEEAWNKIPDITRINSELNWKPRWDLDNIVSEAIAFARGEINVLDPVFEMNSLP